MPSPTDTIFAVSSGAPPAAIAVLRISGPLAFDSVRALAGSLPEPRRAGLRAIRDGDVLLDRVLVLTFPGPVTATGEDLVELHLHGGRAIVAAVERALEGRLDLRRALPGEFTRRALANGRIDLAQAEGLADLLAAETETQRRAALATAEGAVGRAVDRWADAILHLSARAEAMIDFAEEDDVADDEKALAAIRADAARLVHEMTEALDNPSVERLRDGIRIVLAGPPNSGKSTLMNVLADREVSIATPVAGTTRDRIEAPVSRGGVAYVLIDTAGLTASAGDIVEQIGVGIAERSIAEADIVLWLGDDAPLRADAVRVHARADLVERQTVPEGSLAVSAESGAGIAPLWQRIEGAAVALLPRPDRLALNQRQRDHVTAAMASVAGAARETSVELLADRLRFARSALDAITGASDTDAMLDSLFRRFCIGK